MASDLGRELLRILTDPASWKPGPTQVAAAAGRALLSPSPFDDDDEGEDDLAARQDECEHDWKPRGFNINYGTIYECEKCGGVTP